MAITRPSWRKRGPLYTEYGIQIRCVQKDQTGSVSTCMFEPFIAKTEGKKQEVTKMTEPEITLKNCLDKMSYQNQI